MNDKLSLQELFVNTRSRVYFLWAVLVAVGFVTTHYYQNPNINGVWFVLSAIGLGYMVRVMPLRVTQMKYIFASWLVPIAIGILISALAVRTRIAPELTGYLGPFWLVIMAAAYYWNGLVDAPGLWYYIIAAANLLSAAAIYASDSLLPVQYLLTAVISTWSMLMLWVFRND